MSEQADREVLDDDALIEAVGAAIWQTNNELTKPEYRNMPDAEARTHFAHAAIAAILASDLLAQRDRRVAAEAVLEFVAWIARARAHNGSDHQFGQSLYNECVNAALPVWAAEWIMGGE